MMAAGRRTGRHGKAGPPSAGQHTLVPGDAGYAGGVRSSNGPGTERIEEPCPSILGPGEGSCCAAFVAMVESPDLGEDDDPARSGLLHGPAVGGVLPERQVRPAPVVVADVAADHPCEVRALSATT
jgi:hypothetical protein